MCFEGKFFDFKYYEVMFWEFIVEYFEDMVIEELVWGYFLDDIVLCYFMVKVVVVLEEGVEVVNGEVGVNFQYLVILGDILLFFVLFLVFLVL